MYYYYTRKWSFRARDNKSGHIGYAFDSSQSAPKPGRHDPCWFGSGKKYKQGPLKQER